MIFRHEIIGENPKYPEDKNKNKTYELFKNRADRLIYRSIVYDPKPPEPQALKLIERNYGKEVTIKKMTQKFEMDNDPEKSSSTQIRKTEFNLK